MHNVMMPFRFTLLKREYGDRPIHYLDVGCGSNAPTITKRWFPEWKYYGIDRERHGNSEEDLDAMEEYFELDLETDSLDVVPDDFFDVVVLSHVIEHVVSGEKVLEALTTKLKPGGKIYVEFPSERSLGLPSMSGTLNFCDDPTHVRVYSVREISNVLLRKGFRVLRAGKRRDKRRIALFPFQLSAKIATRRKIKGSDFWDVVGFAEFVFAEKLPSNRAG